MPPKAVSPVPTRGPEPEEPFEVATETRVLHRSKPPTPLATAERPALLPPSHEPTPSTVETVLPHDEPRHSFVRSRGARGDDQREVPDEAEATEQDAGRALVLLRYAPELRQIVRMCVAAVLLLWLAVVALVGSRLQPEPPQRASTPHKAPKGK